MKIALVSARPARGLDDDEPPLRAALLRAGCDAATVEWDDPAVDWTSFDLALLRSAWDYAERRQEFLTWAERISALTAVLNPLPIVRWNTDKHYLGELSRLGIAIVPSRFVEPGDTVVDTLEQFLARHSNAEVVVKPAVGAGSRDTARHRRNERAAVAMHVQRLLDAGRSVMLQPYLERIEHAGETALMFFDGEFSHAIRKGPLLPAGGSLTHALFAAETITARTPDDDELHLAEQVMAAIPFATPLYARVDLIRDDNGAPCLLELELTEPSLFFDHARGSVDRFVAAALRRMR